MDRSVGPPTWDFYRVSPSFGPHTLPWVRWGGLGRQDNSESVYEVNVSPRSLPLRCISIAAIAGAAVTVDVDTAVDKYVPEHLTLEGKRRLVELKRFRQNVYEKLEYQVGLPRRENLFLGPPIRQLSAGFLLVNNGNVRFGCR